MKFKEQPASKITFHNQPKLSIHEVDSKFNARRIELIPHVEKFISNHERFKGKEVNVTFAEKGVSSLVSIIETPHEKVVLKIPLSIAHSLGEAQFLKVWEQAGVKVPHVIEDGMINEHSYTLMEYVDAKPLSETYRKGEMVKMGIYVELGKTLRIMHTPEAMGYGRVVDGKAQYSRFEDWLLGDEDVQKKIRYIQEHKLLDAEHGSLELALKILTEHVNRENKSSYCHNDFGTSNTFATNPPTIFDPNPRFNNRYIDLGQTMMRMIYINNGLTQAQEQLIKGYFGDEPFDKRVLQASILLSAYMKFPYSYKTKNLERIQGVREYLVQNKHLLEN